MFKRFLMASQKEMRKMERMVQIIEREGVISKVQLVMKAMISISYYEKLKPFMEELYAHRVQYDKDTRTWRAIRNKQLETKNG